MDTGTMVFMTSPFILENKMFQLKQGGDDDIVGDRVPTMVLPEDIPPNLKQTVRNDMAKNIFKIKKASDYTVMLK